MDDKTVLRHFKLARKYKLPRIEQMKEDFEFAAGKQWPDEDSEKLSGAGIRALTINKIQPNLFLVSGIQRQNRTDFQAYPEGEEDTLLAEISTLLIKNVMKVTAGEYKISEQFEDGIIGGEGWVELFIDYTYDLINGELKIKKLNPFNVYIDPTSVEYDLSDARYMIKFTPDLTKDQVIQLFPDEESKIKKMESGKLSLDLDTFGRHEQVTDYPSANRGNWSEEALEENTFDLTEYYYKKYVDKHLILDGQLGEIKEVEDESQGQEYVQMYPDAKLIKRKMPEVWVCSLVGDEVISDEQSAFYPRWKSYPFVPFFAHRLTTPIDASEYMIQGIVRSLKDPQREINKRRTQELNHLNVSINSGLMYEEGSLVNQAHVKTYGSSPGFHLVVKQGTPRDRWPERMTPLPLSQGHAQLAAESAQDMKEISGINADLLAMDNKTQSGRAIHLRQQQGLVMIQRMLDNFSQSKRLLGRFILSQLGEIYTVDSAAKAIGDAFVKNNFSVPVFEIVKQAKQRLAEDKPLSPNQEKVLEQFGNIPEGAPPPMNPDGSLVMEVDDEAVGAVLAQVLKDAEIGKYDISIGEGANTETVKYANYMMMTEMMQAGVPIPPEVLVEESMVASASKSKIKSAIAAAQQAAQQQGGV